MEYVDANRMLLLTCGCLVCSFEQGEKQDGVYYVQPPSFLLPCVRVVVISEEVICAVTFSECKPCHLVISNIFLSTSQENSAWGRVPFPSQCRLPFKTFLCCFFWYLKTWIAFVLHPYKPCSICYKFVEMKSANIYLISRLSAINSHKKFKFWLCFHCWYLMVAISPS